MQAKSYSACRLQMRNKVQLLAMKSRGHYIQEWRIHRNLTQEQVAERIGLTKATVSRIERGLTKYKQETLEAFSYALACEPADLLSPPEKSPRTINDLAHYVMSLDAEAQRKAMRILKAAMDDERAA